MHFEHIIVNIGVSSWESVSGMTRKWKYSNLLGGFDDQDSSQTIGKQLASYAYEYT